MRKIKAAAFMFKLYTVGKCVVKSLFVLHSSFFAACDEDIILKMVGGSVGIYYP
jgi:hypothetical protein